MWGDTVSFIKVGCCLSPPEIGKDSIAKSLTCDMLNAPISGKTEQELAPSQSSSCQQKQLHHASLTFHHSASDYVGPQIHERQLCDSFRNLTPPPQPSRRISLLNSSRLATSSLIQKPLPPPPHLSSFSADENPFSRNSQASFTTLTQTALRTRSDPDNQREYCSCRRAFTRFS